MNCTKIQYEFRNFKNINFTLRSLLNKAMEVT